MTTVITREVTYRPFGPDQLPDVLGLLSRCSRETLFKRFHGATDGTFHAIDLAARHDHDTLGVWSGTDLVGIATLAAGSGLHEVGVLIEDAWQRRGLGTELLRRLADLALRAGILEVRAEVLGDNGWLLAVLSRVGTVEASVHWGVYSVAVTLRR
jgi:GNAT superfamily N-acetyltransferase